MMMSSNLAIVAFAGAAAVASPLGGLIALWCLPTTLFLSLALGYAAGILLATISLEMVPQALALASPAAVSMGFVAGFLAVYGFDLFVNRGRMAGEKAEQRPSADRFHRRRRPRGDAATVLAGGTSAEELIEGLAIGVGTAIQPRLGLMVALAILIDNVSEGLSIGALIRARPAVAAGQTVRRVLQWTGLVGVALFVAAMAGWFLLRDLPPPVLGTLFAAGAGAMLYLTVTDLVPEAEERHYQQSAALAIVAGFATILVLGRFDG